MFLLDQQPLAQECQTMDHSCRTIIIKFYSFQILTNNIPSDISVSFYLIYIYIYSWCISKISINSCAMTQGFRWIFPPKLGWSCSNSWKIQTNKVLPSICAECLPTTRYSRDLWGWNKPKGLKVAKGVQMIDLMLDMLDCW